MKRARPLGEWNAIAAPGRFGRALCDGSIRADMTDPKVGCWLGRAESIAPRMELQQPGCGKCECRFPQRGKCGRLNAVGPLAT